MTDKKLRVVQSSYDDQHDDNKARAFFTVSGLRDYAAYLRLAGDFQVFLEGHGETPRTVEEDKAPETKAPPPIEGTRPAETRIPQRSKLVPPPKVEVPVVIPPPAAPTVLFSGPVTAETAPALVAAIEKGVEDLNAGRTLTTAETSPLETPPLEILPPEPEEDPEVQRAWVSFDNDASTVKTVTDAVRVWKAHSVEVRKLNDPGLKARCSVSLSSHLARALNLPVESGPAEAEWLIKEALKQPSPPPQTAPSEAPKTPEGSGAAPVPAETGGVPPEVATAFLTKLGLRKERNLTSALLVAVEMGVREEGGVRTVSRADVTDFLTRLGPVDPVLVDTAAVKAKVEGSQFPTYAAMARAKVVP